MVRQTKRSWLKNHKKLKAACKFDYLELFSRQLKVQQRQIAIDT